MPLPPITLGSVMLPLPPIELLAARLTPVAAVPVRVEVVPEALLMSAPPPPPPPPARLSAVMLSLRPFKSNTPPLATVMVTPL